MIYEAINCIQRELNPTIVRAVAGNISEILSEGNNSTINEVDIIISLVNIEEIRMIRDPKNYINTGSNILSKNPPVHLKLTLLFTALRSEAAYDLSLQNIQKVIQFFQRKYVFDHANTPILDAGIERLIMEMVSVNIEQLNHLWVMQGGKYQPSVMYGMRMVAIDSISDQPSGLITQIETSFEVKK